MADENISTATTTMANTDSAVAGNMQTAPEGTAPTAEQQTAFQKFLGGLFGGKEKESAPADKGGSSAPDAKQELEGKAYTAADLQTKLNEARAAWVAEQDEQTRLAKLSPEDRAKAEADAKDKKLADMETRLLQRDLKDTALARLEKEGFPIGLADLLNYTDQASVEKSLASVQEIFKASLEMAVKERLRGKTPEGLGRAATAENALNDQIAKNIRGGLN